MRNGLVPERCIEASQKEGVTFHPRSRRNGIEMRTVFGAKCNSEVIGVACSVSSERLELGESIESIVKLAGQREELNRESTGQRLSTKVNQTSVT